MFEWLFPHWSNPGLLAAIVALRVVLNVALVGVVAESVGRRSAPTALAATATVLSAVLTVLALRPGWVGLTGSYVELGTQLTVLLVAGYAVWKSPSFGRAVATGLASLAAAGLLLFMIPIYGEAFVAP